MVSGAPIKQLFSLEDETVLPQATFRRQKDERSLLW